MISGAETNNESSITPQAKAQKGNLISLQEKDYTINNLAKLAGVSTRTLRYYDQIGLLSPGRISSNDYRAYTQREVDRLQHILFYRELGVPLETIKQLLTAPGFDEAQALKDHLSSLQSKREQLDKLIATVELSLAAKTGETAMSNEEKFEGFKKSLIESNEKTYGKEAREAHGDDAIDKSNAKMMGMTEEQFAQVEELSNELNETLRTAFEQGDPAGELAQKACALHKEWLCNFWTTYSKDAHKGLAQMYVDDERFTAHYDEIAPGCAPFLRDAIDIYCA